ncbi:MAG TPA: hypothetical protein VLC95_12845, partial [Anaerolineae bacterium]|nr:hypothetical protein [Anaerolineae bacterium]
MTTSELGCPRPAAGATFTLMGVKEDVGGELAYYNQVPCDREAPSCYQWHFTPYEPLPTGLYTAEVFGVTDRAGLGLDGPYPWSFEVTDGIGGEVLAPPAAGPQTEEGGEPAAAAEPAGVPETVEPAAEEEPLDAPAGEGGEIESGLAGVLYVRRTSYYYFGAQRVAMRQVDTWGGDVVYYLLSDHLGTTSLVLCGNVSGCDGMPNGGRVAESRHYPYGEVRWTWPADGSTFPTDYRFTGQRSVGLGLTHMGARFLDSC